MYLGMGLLQVGRGFVTNMKDYILVMEAAILDPPSRYGSLHGEALQTVHLVLPEFLFQVSALSSL